MVQTTKCLPCKPEVVSSIPKTHMKGEKNVHGGLVLGKHMGSWGLLATSPSLISEPWVPLRDLASESKV